MTPYDRWPWQGAAHAFACPSRLAALAHLHGLASTPPHQATYLEVGCGDGTHLLSLAQRFPNLRLYGFEASAQACELLRQRARMISASNLEVFQLDLSTEEAPKSLPPMDYIFCHRQISWVSPAARQHLLGRIAKLLAPNGLALLSFLVWPGQHDLEPLVALMRHHVAHLDSPTQQVEQALAIAAFQVERLATQHGPAHALGPDKVLHDLSQLSPEALYHDLLAPERHPQTLLSLCEELAPHQLRYLTNARLSEPRLSQVEAIHHADLRALPSPEARQHALDHLLMTPFRTALFCHQAVQTQSSVDAAAFASFYGHSLVVPEELPPTIEHPLETNLGSYTLTQEQLDLLSHLSHARPQSLALYTFGPAEVIGTLVASLWQMGALELFTSPSPYRHPLAPYPRAGHLQRLLAQAGHREIPSLHGRMVALDSQAKEVVLGCDGQTPADHLDPECLAHLYDKALLEDAN